MGIQQLSNRNKFALLIGLMAVIAVGVAGITLAVLYKTAYREQHKRLQEIAQTKARYIEAIAQYNLRLNPHDPGIAYSATLEQVKQAHEGFIGLGDTGEITLAKVDHQRIIYVLNGRMANLSNADTGSLDSPQATPMQRALQGRSGIMAGKDYRGVKVLAAYEPVGVFGWGLVAKIDYSELEAPFIRAGIHSAVFGLLVILVGTWMFRRISSPLIYSVEKTESQLNTILNTVVDSIITTDAAGKILSVNTSAEKMFGYAASEIIGANVNKLMPAQYRRAHKQIMNKQESTAENRIIGVSREVYGRRKDGSEFPVEISLGKANIAEQVIFTGIIRDITERRRNEEELKRYREDLEHQVAQRTQALARANRKLEQLAREDALTGIANRRVFDEVLTQEIRRAKRNKKPLSLIICDIDYFKNYNDTYGHLAGDRCLQKVAKTIESGFQRAGELVARYGGEEFAIILPLLDKEAAAERAENIRLAIWDLNIIHESSKIDQRVSVSLGVATTHSDAVLNLAELIHAADNALYAAKHNGRNCVASDPPTDHNPVITGTA
ncbi:MAG: diguanylate cyclase [Gammaproteobacteria bacterium]|nr:diguanylate cyclase [Gammaproteobacteria bacterium]